jgi:hypothetical protein
MQDSIDKTLYVYIGSASDYRGGLSIRKCHMLSRLTRPHDEALKRKIKDLGLNSGDLKTLFTVSFENGFDGDVMDVRALVILARWALMVWLGAVDDGLKPVIKDLVPWGEYRIVVRVSRNPRAGLGNLSTHDLSRSIIRVTDMQ